MFVGKQARFISNSFRPISGAEERRVRVAAHGSVVVASWMAACCHRRRFVFFCLPTAIDELPLSPPLPLPLEVSYLNTARGSGAL